MADPITRGAILTREDVAELLRVHVDQLEKRGGSITLQDPRVSKLTSWALVTAATIGLGFIGWLALSVNELSAGLRENTTELRGYNKRFDDFRADYNADKADVQARLRALELKP